MNSPFIAQLLQRNAAYYRAFEACDLAATLAEWCDRPDVLCIGPVGEPAIGPEAVAALYRELYAGAPSQRVEVEVVGVSFDDPVGTVTCLERVIQAETVWELLATNLFVLGRGGWGLLHHHASWRRTNGRVPFEVIPVR